MKSYRVLASSLVMGCGIAVISATALAQPGDCGPMMGWERYSGQQRMEHFQQHQKNLHDALKLKPEQEEAWKTFADSMQPMARMMRPPSEDWSKLTAPERADRMLEFQKQHQERMTEHVAALKNFYAVLTPEQKKIFDAQHFGPRGGRYGPRRSPGDGRHPDTMGSDKG